MNKNIITSYKEEAEKHMEAAKRVYKNKKSIFVKNVEEVLYDDFYINRYDEWILKRIGIGYMMMALEANEEIMEKLAEEDIDDLIYSIVCVMDDTAATEAIEESNKYNLAV